MDNDEPKLHIDMDTPRRHFYSQHQLEDRVRTARAEALRENGTFENPFTKTFNAKVFKRHDSSLSISVCERDDGFEILVSTGLESKLMMYAINPDGEMVDLADKQEGKNG